MPCWQRWRLNDNPYNLDPITEKTLDLFVGRDPDVQLLQESYREERTISYQQGESGIGSTALGNFVRFGFMQRKTYFSPLGEISLPTNLCCHCLAGNILAAINWGLLQTHSYISRDPDFLEHADRTREFIGRQDSQFCSKDHDLNDIGLRAECELLLNTAAKFAYKFGYQKGILIQTELKNQELDMHSELATKFMVDLCNFFKLSDYRWLIVGNHEFGRILGKYAEMLQIAKITYSELVPLGPKDFDEILQRRKDYYSIEGDSKLPICSEAARYLYSLTDGNIRDTLKICYRLSLLLEGDHTVTTMSFDAARHMLRVMYQRRLRERNLTDLPLKVLEVIAKDAGLTAGNIADKLRRHPCSISRALAELTTNELVRYERRGRHRFYSPRWEAKLAWA